MYKRYEALRDARKMTDAQVADLSGVAPQTLSAWKLGLYVPKIDKLMRIAEALNVPITDLIGEGKQ